MSLKTIHSWFTLMKHLRDIILRDITTGDSIPLSRLILYTEIFNFIIALLYTYIKFHEKDRTLNNGKLYLK